MILVGLGSNKKNLNTMNSSIICAWISTTGHILQWHDINQPLINREVETTYISFFTVNEKIHLKELSPPNVLNNLTRNTTSDFVK